jgi:hypothetical protein
LLKLPTTETADAWGAQTRKATPAAWGMQPMPGWEVVGVEVDSVRVDIFSPERAMFRQIIEPPYTMFAARKNCNGGR